MSNIYKEAVDHFGADRQLEQLEEELTELLLAVKHFRKGKDTEAHLVSEIADVKIMLWQMNYVFTPDHIEDAVDYKRQRLEDRIEAEKHLKDIQGPQ
jgi:hypothetical protein